MGGHDIQNEPALHDMLSMTLGRVDTMMSKGWELNRLGGDLWIWRPRELNKAPDAICNYVMDHRCNVFKIFIDATRFQQKPNLYISSDGGCRVDDGISATGWVIRAGGYDSSGTYRIVEIARGGTFFSRTFNSFHIEALAMNEVTDACLRCF